jgi:hypothetical protein
VVLQIRTAKSPENIKKFGSYSLLKNPGFPRILRVSGQLLWQSVAPMQIGAYRLRRCISRHAPKIESSFEAREALKHWGFALPPTAFGSQQR